MGVENSILKKKKNKNGVIKFAKKNFKHRASETLETKKVPTILDNINPDDNIFETRPQSRTVKMLNYQKTSEDKTIKSEQERENCLKNLKSLSVENLVKIENHNDEVLPGSLETNCSSNKSKEDFKKILNDDVYNDMDENNSFEEENEDNNEEEKEENENDAKEVEKKKKELMVTNNMKTVFIDSKPTNKEENEESKLSTSTSTSPMTTFDYELNFYRNGNDIRQSYLAKLLSTKVWTPNMKPKQHNSIIIFDWDDTLLPTTFLTPGGIFNEDIRISENDQEKLMEIEISALKLLTESVEKGNVYIITNAGKGWVEYSAKRFFPSIIHILEKIKIISARGQYEKIFPGNSRQWKIEAFLNLQKNLNLKLVTNIICLGDSLYEMEAGRILASRFTEAFIKTIKFKEAPNLDELLKQLKVVSSQFGIIYSRIKNLTIRVEKKKKEECL